ncbi:rRNA pseudouridine synthase [Amphibacillus sp. MSJ-3]|uniref:pseudouridine synthase n=1 Tax=Amphibacillus sp. MSJ-3 TaxID=2841505 RepID=UPI001C0EF06A|nr:pseudouridine synthase [Amphibacillus sp. MSJ-3]MBU5593713.1 rRNA pseudouridine synthase [Amphibacillus sp. MSJ-3]
MRLDKLLSHSGYGSRKEVKQLLKSGQVTVNDQIIHSGKAYVDPEKDLIMMNGEQVVYEEFVYYLLHKPAGVVSATEDLKDKTVLDLLDPRDQVKSPFPVGRLDKDTEGLLLITNDGKLAHQLLSPKNNIGKTYFAKIDQKVTEEDKIAFKHGVVLDDGYQTKPADLVILKSDDISEVEVTITEGKFHQVKRMFEALGKHVVYLKRIAMEQWKLDEALEQGEYRRLSEAEITYLKQLK